MSGELESVLDALQGLNLSRSIAEGREEFDNITRTITTGVDEVIQSESVNDHMIGSCSSDSG